MSFFTIAGKNDCPNCAHALYVAEYLQKHLPNFKYRPVLLAEGEWQVWLDKQNSENKWHHTQSPIIWKEVSRRGGKVYLIGGLGEFWEYCYDYYGFLSRIPKKDLTKIVADNLLIASKQIKLKPKIITIIGAINYLSELLIFELENCFESKEDEKILFRLYDEGSDDPDTEFSLLVIANEVIPSLKGFPDDVTVVTSLEKAISDCDLLIVITDYSKKPKEELDDWLSRCMTNMLFLADEINRYAKRNLRVILNHPGPVCFNASVLVEYCTSIRLANIVAVTADEGISVINTVAEKTEELVENFGCPPVWGFSGIMSYVDIPNTIIKTEVYRPFKRSTKSKETSKLPKGRIKHELRLLWYLLNCDDELYLEIEERKKKKVSLLECPFLLPKIRATASLVKLWFAEEITDDIISLGICSNGSFDFPPGVVFSQAVTLNEKHIWEPSSNFPLTTNTSTKIHNILLEVTSILQKFGLGEKMDY